MGNEADAIRSWGELFCFIVNANNSVSDPYLLNPDPEPGFYL
jgi:hypothetical protein